MIIIEDTRNKPDKHIEKNAYFAANGITVERHVLKCGDYSLSLDETVCIDTKQDVLELSSNICGKQHRRFKNLCIRAQQNNTKLIILIEEPLSLDTLHTWSSPVRKYGAHKGQPFTQVKGETLKKAMFTMEQKYGCEFLFCSREQSGAKIVELLTQK